MNFLTAFNHNLKRVSRIADLLCTFIESSAVARAQGAEIIDLRDKPNAQPSYTLLPEIAEEIRASGQRVPRRVSPIHRDPETGERLSDKGTFELDQLRLAKMPGYETGLRVDDVMAVVRSIDALKRQARLVAWLERHRAFDMADAAAKRALANQREAVAKLRELDPSLFDEAVRDFDKAHVENFDDSVALDVTGFHWTASLKGDATETRYREDRAIGSNSKRDMAHADMPVHQIDEDALIAA
jgi:hypothetical protein